MPSSPFAVRRSARPLVVVFAALSTACYDLLPMSSASMGGAPSDVELALTDSGSVIIARTVGPGSTAIRGLLVADSAESYVVAVREVKRRDQDAALWRGERIAVPHALVASVRARRLSRTRTTLLVLVGGAGVVLARTAIAAAGGSNAGGSTSGGGAPK